MDSNHGNRNNRFKNYTCNTLQQAAQGSAAVLDVERQREQQQQRRLVDRDRDVNSSFEYSFPKNDKEDTDNDDDDNANDDDEDEDDDDDATEHEQENKSSDSNTPNEDNDIDDDNDNDDENDDDVVGKYIRLQQQQYSSSISEDPSEVISNNSTPYYTPMDFLHSSFEFPSPKLVVERLSEDENCSDSPSSTSTVTVASQRIAAAPITDQAHSPTPSLTKITPPSTSHATHKFLQLNAPTTSSSPSPLTPGGMASRKLRRFSLYERRSCSPQRLLIKSAAISVDSSSGGPTDHQQRSQPLIFVDDKENTKPKFGGERNIAESPTTATLLGQVSDSPIIFDDGSNNTNTGNSPRILESNARLAYSPKLLASINNLNLTGSPLGVISSAGYKNGNYFKFPEIDHVVHGSVGEISLDQRNVGVQQDGGSGGGSGGDNQQTIVRNNRSKGTIASKLSISGGNTSPPVSSLAKTNRSLSKTIAVNQENGQQQQPQTPSIGASAVCRTDQRKNRKNKNNLTIRITSEAPPGSSNTQLASSASPKPKTPTIKNTKEKALSLDSAAAAANSETTAAVAAAAAGLVMNNRTAGLAVVVPPGVITSGIGFGRGRIGHMETHASCNELQNSACYRMAASGSQQMRFRSANVSQERLLPASAALRSTSLSHLSSFSAADMHSKSLNNLQRSNSRRRGGGSGSAVGPPSSSTSSGKKSAASDGDSRFFVEFDETSALREDEDETISPHRSIITQRDRDSMELEEFTPKTHTLVPPHRSGGGLKLNTPLLHHASNTNLKTLPEFLTLVEFNTSNSPKSGGSGGGDTAYPFKQKSMDLPSSTAGGGAGTSIVTAGHPPPPLRMKTASTSGITSTTSTNLLQRRGSNHSLTLNLHGSCSNLLGSSRCGLSVSNYSLGSSTNLNSKSSCHLDLNTAITPQSSSLHPSGGLHLPGASLSVAGSMPSTSSSTQGTKQSLFRRRGSNHSLTLSANLTAISCGNLLNSFASQNSLNATLHTGGGGGGLGLSTHCGAGGGGAGGGGGIGSVTRTTSFITPTSNTTSNAAMTPKRGLLERRGSNQSLTLNMGSSFGGIGYSGGGGGGAGIAIGVGAGNSTLATSNLYLMGDSTSSCMEEDTKSNAAAACCAHQTHYRKFFSSENLNRANTQFADLNQAHKRNSKQLCFGSVADLKPSGDSMIVNLESCALAAGGEGARKELFDFQESTMCTCTGVRNVMTTRPLSPQTTSEEFKIYLANIQMLQNASNALNQIDLIKLNYIFDNSYAASGDGGAQTTLPMLNVPSGGGSSGGGNNIDGHAGMSGNNRETSEDCEVSTRYLNAIQSVMSAVQLTEDEQKRMFRELHKEFWDLPLNHQEKPMVFGSQAKNRYKTILPNENSRVLLKRENQQLAEFCVEQEELENEQSATGVDIMKRVICEEIAAAASAELNNTTEEGPPYINANYIKGPDYISKCYVATQGPLPNTIFEFWLMIYQNTWRHLRKSASESRHGSPDFRGKSDITSSGNRSNVMQQYYPKIVMLANFLESNRQKCSVYFPMELHEIFVSAAKGAVMTPTDALSELLEPYLQSTKTPSTLSTKTSNRPLITQASIDCFRLEPSVEICEAAGLPPTHTNFFVLKNVGIVRKNGYSIRKIVVLYCTQLHLNGNAVMTSTNPRRILLIQRLYCYHYWYPDWPDHRSPRDINTLVDICLHILNLGKCETEFELFEDSEPATPTPTPTFGRGVLSASDGGRHNRHIETSQNYKLYQQDIFNIVQPLPVIHCSAGIGRTGCLTAILNGVRQLRQSLAYSLTSMAAAASKKSAGPDAKLVLSPVDFCLPKQFMQQQPSISIAQPQKETSQTELLSPLLPELLSDTDSSYTRNTLLYIKYILERNNSAPFESPITVHNSADDEVTPVPSTPDTNTTVNSGSGAMSVFALEKLPRLPDIFVDILGIVCNLRLQRGGMVQNSEQYELIHRTICLYLKRTFALKRF